MNRTNVCGLLLSLIWFGSASDAVPSPNVLETAQPATVLGDGGYVVSSTSFLAARFTVAETTQVTGLAGNLASGPLPRSALFAAIVKLGSPTAMPVNGTFANASSAFAPQDVVATTLFSAGSTASTLVSRHIEIPFSSVIAPGSYALVFGSGLFGANAEGYMPDNNPTIAGQASPMAWGPSTFSPELGQYVYSWSNFPINATTMRFVVEGHAIPEPATAALVMAAVGAAAMFSRRVSWRMGTLGSRESRA